MTSCDANMTKPSVMLCRELGSNFRGIPSGTLLLQFRLQDQQFITAGSGIILSIQVLINIYYLLNVVQIGFCSCLDVTQALM